MLVGELFASLGNTFAVEGKRFPRQRLEIDERIVREV